MAVSKFLSSLLRTPILPTAHSIRNNVIPAVETETASIGRSAAGKSTFFTAMNLVAADQHMRSGLRFSTGNGTDPGAVIDLLNTTRQRIKDLADTGLPSTLESTVASYNLFEGAERRVHWQMWESVGQVLTSPNENPRVKQKYQAYISMIKRTDCIWVFAPLPCAQIGASQFDYDVKVAAAYLNHAVGLERNKGQKCSVALILTKIDGTFADQHEARQTLTDDLLISALGPLVNICVTNDNVEAAVIAPTSAMGFGQTEALPDRGQPVGHDNDFDVASMLNDEPTYTLKDGATMTPFNVSGLLYWTILKGILAQSVNTTNGQSQAMTRIVKKLRQDLAESDPWLVRIKD